MLELHGKSVRELHDLILTQERIINSLTRELNRTIKNTRISKTRLGKTRGSYIAKKGGMNGTHTRTSHAVGAS